LSFAALPFSQRLPKHGLKADLLEVWQQVGPFRTDSLETFGKVPVIVSKRGSSARKSASQDSSTCANCLICVLTKEALLPSFSLGFSFAMLRSLLRNRCFDKAGQIGGVICADPQNAAIPQPEDDRIPAPQVLDPAVRDCVVGRLLRLRFVLSPRPGKMKNSWKQRQAIRKPELETIIAHRRKWRSKVESATTTGLPDGETWEYPEWAMNCKRQGGEAVTEVSPRSCWRRSDCTS
jgi:hypothetical protein